ncbi:hypothetical protein U8P80_28905 (plasmid) [Rhizobium beringeri]|nr:hypothetical protein LZK82_28865 [Rhizobium leguminosarum]UIK14972.1 hypothetical protein LZK80_34505 [Rhizobium leguminosarum]UIL31838.1 hypothetical protein LZK75_34710 [Rhizobium leguminosarum]WSG77341.1 hypothetical protein U8P80_28905 [Rhizobium beringeri]WSH17536.1 hypothetical protein U8P74_28905 [Rhizobium beringeri]
MAVVIDHRHDAAQTIVSDLCDRPGVNRKDEFMGLRFLPEVFKLIAMPQRKSNFGSTLPWSEPNCANQAHIAATVA